MEAVYAAFLMGQSLNTFVVADTLAGYQRAVAGLELPLAGTNCFISTWANRSWDKEEHTMSRFTLTAFADEIGADLDLQLSELNRHDIHYVEFRGPTARAIADYTLQEARQAKRRMDAAGVKVSAVGSPMGKIGIEEDFFRHLETFTRLSTSLRSFRTPTSACSAFFIPGARTPRLPGAR